MLIVFSVQWNQKAPPCRLQSKHLTGSLPFKTLSNDSIILGTAYKIAVEFLGIRVDGKTRLVSESLKLFLVNALIRMDAASLPISKAGCVMVVNDGLSRGAVSRLEKLIIFTSAGIDNFRLLHT